LVASRRVERTVDFVDEALRYFPLVGTSQRNSFKVLDDTVLTPLEAELALHGRFERLSLIEPGSPIRFFTTVSAFIPAIVIYIGLARDTIFLMGIECDLDYWDLIGKDPDD